jgi:radical SAM superfamily enzyme YgiQ (UPF0313 family)
MSGKKMLLLYPKTPDTYWSFKHALKFIGKKALMPPLGLATIAALFPEGYDIRIIDMNAEALRDKDLLWADLVLLSAMIVQKASFTGVVERCTGLGIPTAAGGPYPTSCFQEIRGVDYFILGEGETTFPLFLKDWEKGCPRPVYEEASKPSMSCTPVPRFDLFDVRKYNVLPLQFSRGCPFGCEFCDIVSLFGRVPRTKPPARFIQELDAAMSTGFDGSIFVVDDNFIGNKAAVKELLREIALWQKTRKRRVQFCTEASINLASDPELLDLMVEAGFYMVFVGLETPVESSLECAGKTQNLNGDVLEAVRTIQARGIEVSGGFIVGFDTDPGDVFDRQIGFIKDLAVPTAMIGILTALPRTRLFDRLKAEGRLLAASSGNNTHDLDMNFKPVLPREQLVTGYLRILSEIYSPKVYFKRCLEFFRRLPPARQTHVEGAEGGTFSLRNIRAIVRSFFRQTFSSYGPAYIAYLFKALVRYPDHIVRIITMAIQGHHLFRITRRTVKRSRYAGGQGA